MRNVKADEPSIPQARQELDRVSALASGRQLRLATAADLEGIMRLERYCFSPWLAFGHLRWKRLFSRPAVQIWLVVQGEQVLAYLCLVPHSGWRSLSVHAVAVHWQVRHQGGSYGWPLRRIWKASCGWSVTASRPGWPLVICAGSVSSPALRCRSGWWFRVSKCSPTSAWCPTVAGAV